MRNARNIEIEIYFLQILYICILEKVCWGIFKLCLYYFINIEPQKKKREKLQIFISTYRRLTD